MTYRLDGVEYDEDEFDKMEVEEINSIRELAEKLILDQNITIKRAQTEWIEHDRDPRYGLTREEFNRRIAIREEAEGLVKSIKVYLG